MGGRDLFGNCVKSEDRPPENKKPTVSGGFLCRRHLRKEGWLCVCALLGREHTPAAYLVKRLTNICLPSLMNDASCAWLMPMFLQNRHGWMRYT